MKKNKLGWILFILFFISFIGTIYFINYNPSRSNTGLAIFFYAVAFLSLIAIVVYGRNNIKKQWAEAYSLPNRKKSILAFVVFAVGAGIINCISQYIGGQSGFTIGLILGLILLVIFFYIFRKKK